MPENRALADGNMRRQVEQGQLGWRKPRGRVGTLIFLYHLSMILWHEWMLTLTTLHRGVSLLSQLYINKMGRKLSIAPLEKYCEHT